MKHIARHCLARSPVYTLALACAPPRPGISPSGTCVRLRRAGRCAVHGPASPGWLLVALCAATGAYCLLRMRSGVEEQRRTAGGEALMGFGMAAMAVPAAVARAAALGLGRLRGGVRGGRAARPVGGPERAPHHLHHLVGAFAMVYMAGVMATLRGTGHGGRGPALTGVLLLYFTGYVLWSGTRLMPVAARRGWPRTERPGRRVGRPPGAVAGVPPVDGRSRCWPCWSRSETDAPRPGDRYETVAYVTLPRQPVSSGDAPLIGFSHDGPRGTVAARRPGRRRRAATARPGGLAGPRTGGRPVGVAVRGGGRSAVLRAVDDAQRGRRLAGRPRSCVRSRAALPSWRPTRCAGGPWAATTAVALALGGVWTAAMLVREVARARARRRRRPGRTPRARPAVARRGARQRPAGRPGGRASGRLVAARRGAPTRHHHGRVAPPRRDVSWTPCSPTSRGTRGPGTTGCCTARPRWPTAFRRCRCSPRSATRCTGWSNSPPTTWPRAASAASRSPSRWSNSTRTGACSAPARPRRPMSRSASTGCSTPPDRLTAARRLRLTAAAALVPVIPVLVTFVPGLRALG